MLPIQIIAATIAQYTKKITQGLLFCCGIIRRA
jgi:hypothetical protein